MIPKLPFFGSMAMAQTVYTSLKVITTPKTNMFHTITSSTKAPKVTMGFTCLPETVTKRANVSQKGGNEASGSGGTVVSEFIKGHVRTFASKHENHGIYQPSKSGRNATGASQMVSWRADVDCDVALPSPSTSSLLNWPVSSVNFPSSSTGERNRQSIFHASYKIFLTMTWSCIDQSSSRFYSNIISSNGNRAFPSHFVWTLKHLPRVSVLLPQSIEAQHSLQPHH